MTQIVKFRIVGVSPLLMHRPGGMIRGGTEELGTGRKIPTPDEEAKLAEYRNESGVLYLDGMAIRASVIGPGGGASGRKIGKRTANASVAAGFFVQSAQCPLYHPKTKKPVTTYRIDTEIVRLLTKLKDLIETRVMASV